jgi:hypothetical protein
VCGTKQGSKFLKEISQEVFNNPL